MSDTDSGAPAGAPGHARHTSNLLRSVLIAVVALAVFGVALWYVGGVDYVMGLLGGGKPATAPTTATTKPAPPAAATASAFKLPAGVDEMLAKRMYVEQLESSKNLSRLADGSANRFVINRVDATDSTATIALTAFFKDGTSAPGVMYLVKRSGSWYFMSIGGMNAPNASGMAGGVSTQGGTELGGSDLQHVEKGMMAAGIKTFDTGVINSMLSQQTVNQPMLKEIVAGTYTTYEFGAPSIGTGTVTVPVTLKGKSGDSAKGEIVLIKSTIDSHDFTFLTTFKKQ